ncbi:ABC transporter permease [Luedemannella flava]
MPTPERSGGGGMNIFGDAIVWLNDPLNWTNPDGILARAAEHLFISVCALALAFAIAVPVGVVLGHTGRGGGFIVALANLTLAVPTMALLTLFVVAGFGAGYPPIILALTVFGIPPLLSNAYLGMREVDPDVRDAARGMGLSGAQVVGRVELPLAVPYILSGFRTAAVQIVATATLAAFVNGGGLGMIISRGFGLGLASGGGQVVAGGLIVIALCLALEGLLALTQRALTPRALRQGYGVRPAQQPIGSTPAPRRRNLNQTVIPTTPIGVAKIPIAGLAGLMSSRHTDFPY